MQIDEQINRVADWVRYPLPAAFSRDAEEESTKLWRTVRAATDASGSRVLAAQLTAAKTVLGQFHHRRYRFRRRPIDLAKAIICLSQVADDHQRIPPDLTPVVGRFADRRTQVEVGTSLLDGFEPELVEAGILLVAAHAAGSPELRRVLFLAYLRRYQDSRAPADLEHGIELGDRVIATTDDAEIIEALARAYLDRYALHTHLDDLERARELLHDVPSARGALGVAYRLLYDHTGIDNHLDRAIDFCESTHLAIALARRFERDATLPDLDRAWTLVVPPVDVESAADIVALLLLRYRHRGDRSSLDRAVTLAKDTLAELPDHHPRLHGLHLALAAALHQRYLGGGAEADLHQAVKNATWAHRSRPANNTAPDSGAVLAEIHLTRYARNGVGADLDAAARLTTDAAVSARIHHARYLATQDRAEIDRAVELGDQAVRTTRAGRASLPDRQAQLALHLRIRDAEGDLAMATALAEGAVAATGTDHVDLPDRRAVLADAYLARFRADPDAAHLAEAVSASERAWELVRADPQHPRRIRRAGELARCLLEAARIDAPVPADTVRALADEVFLAPSASPHDQVAAQHAVGELLLAIGEPDLAVPVLDAAIRLLPSLPPREADWADRLGTQSGLVQAAVAARCAVADPAGAVTVAELGRGVLLAAEAGIRVDLSQLRSARSQLADRFEWVCERLNTPDFPTSERKRWWRDYDELLAEIRDLPGFGDFLAEPAERSLRPEAGTAVLVSAHRRGGHAVLVRSDAEPVVVDLPDLVDVEARVAAMLNVVQGNSLAMQMRRRPVLLDTLAWLWDAVVGPVISALPSTRVWWVPTGVLGLLPLHAAGHPGEQGALDLVVSSYTPSLRVLRAARSRPPAAERRVLAVAMPQDLATAAEEVKSLRGTTLVDTAATGDAVLAAMGKATWAHFACHAITDPVSPAAGGLVLHDRDVLLPEIGGLHLPDAELAYLSACSTANHGTRHADEVLHLASAFHLAGFRHVIATLWPLHDTTGATAAHAFYDRLPDSPTAPDAATTLRHVTRELRDSDPQRPDRWAALIHSGP
ncbi:CHAT domain-containing protein [Actinokineospora auranticolor]|uniref:CHAT domain-containing protein n=1 Tax=Actinokineospora auranticolor TaxID=155976 RepID=A0A2S6GIM9_9PSEU|nr:CHAT domain-containing protein [Actinokineospora auranticolor]